MRLTYVVLKKENHDNLKNRPYALAGVEGVPTLSRFSESPSCWYLRVTLTPERPSYNSCIVTVHLLPVHPAHPSQ